MRTSIKINPTSDPIRSDPIRYEPIFATGRSHRLMSAAAESWSSSFCSERNKSKGKHTHTQPANDSTATRSNRAILWAAVCHSNGSNEHLCDQMRRRICSSISTRSFAAVLCTDCRNPLAQSARYSFGRQCYLRTRSLARFRRRRKPEVPARAQDATVKLASGACTLHALAKCARLRIQSLSS